MGHSLLRKESTSPEGEDGKNEEASPLSRRRCRHPVQHIGSRLTMKRSASSGSKATSSSASKKRAESALPTAYWWCATIPLHESQDNTKSLSFRASPGSRLMECPDC